MDEKDFRESFGQFCEHRPTQQKQNICVTFVQRRLNEFDVGPTLYKWYRNVLY